MKTKAAFWDTSALLPLCCFQQTTQAAHRVRRQLSQMIAWWGTSVEIRSGVSRLFSESSISEKDRGVTIQRWHNLLDGLDVVEPTATLLEIAIDLPETYGVRALDAFQLAAALVWCSERPRNRPFICADKRLGDAASDAGFDVILLA